MNSLPELVAIYFIIIEEGEQKKKIRDRFRLRLNGISDWRGGVLGEKSIFNLKKKKIIINK